MIEAGRDQDSRYDSIRLKNQLCFPLYACAKEMMRQYCKPQESLQLTYTQYVVMIVLWEFGGMTEGELGERVFLNSGTLTPLVTRSHHLRNTLRWGLPAQQL